MSSARQKAKDLTTLALDERTPEKERIAAAFNALKLIEKHGLLDSPLEGIMNSDNETIKAASTVFERLTNPDLVRSLKKVRDGLSRRRGSR